ncbi:MAG: RNB domain-containing ribonuclease [Opitutaceae bacterium]|nr:RNB domain-containing ribonuclease [Opitutaceae bacterium]
MKKLNERLLELLHRQDYKPLDDAGIARAIGIDKRKRGALAHEIRLLAAAGTIDRVKGDRIALRASSGAASQSAIVGRISFRQSGHALVTAARKPNEGGPSPDPIFIPAEETDVAMHGDLVEVKVLARSGGGKIRGKGVFGGEREQRGRVLRVVERARDTMVGQLRKIRTAWYVAPDDPRFVHEISVPDPTKGRLQPLPAVGDKVVVKLAPWTARHKAPEGEVIERLGTTFEPRAELLGVYRKFDLDPTFPDAVLREVADLPDAVGASEIEGREDYRQRNVFTIDPDDAKDFDDALSIEPRAHGEIQVGIHIADVSAYVRQGTALDREAQRRGNSTYLVGTVVPMLPEKLSNGLCSLVEAQDRLCKAVILTFDRNAKLRSTRFANTVIRSRKRLTYRQAYAFLFTDDLDRIRALPLPARHQTGSTGRALNSLKDLELSELQGWIRALWKIAKRLREDRMAAGSLDLDMPETKIFVDEDGYADRIERIEHDESHQLIEEFMLAANESVARATKERHLASLYRVHDKPDEDKLAELRDQLAVFHVKTGDLVKRDEVVKLLKSLHSHPQGYTLRTQLLRSLKKAAYRASPDGHYGLNKRDYTHFTSPIRRYSDLVVHRVFDSLLPGARGGAGGQTRTAYSAGQMESLGEHLSLTETNSQEAERESQKIKLAEFFERELLKKDKTVFKAIITDIRGQGLFIELTESMTFGFVSLTAFTDDTYAVMPDGASLVGRRHKRRLTLGGKLEVVVSAVDRFKRQIDFKPV